MPKEPKRVFFNARFLTQSASGVQRYAAELISATDRLIGLGEVDSAQLSFSLLAPRQPQRSLNLTNIPTKQVGRFQGHLWEQAELPLYTKGGLLFSPGNTSPVSTSKQIVTIHDAAVFAVPQAFSQAFRVWYKTLLPRVGRVARKVLTDSEFSKRELVRYCGVAADKIQVIPLGSEHVLRNVPDDSVIEKHDLHRRPFILAVSNQNPSKNFAALARALQRLDTSSFDVVIVGGVNPKVFQTSVELPSEDIKYIGYVDDEELLALYKRAACFIYPSLYEGFGLPPLEAMTCGCPVIVSDAASLPEVCGDAALYCDPYSPQDIAEKIQRVMGDDKLASGLKQRGLERAKLFSWEACARETVKTILEVLEGS